MTRSLPNYPQPRDRPLDAGQRSFEAMCLAKMQNKQIVGPDGLSVAELTRVGIYKLLNDGVDDASDGRRTTGSLSVGKAVGQFEFGTLLEARDPVVDGRPRHAEAGSDIADGISRAEPEKGLGTTQDLSIIGILNQVADCFKVVVGNVDL